MIELDVHLCKSGEVVVIHNKKVNSTTNGKGYVKNKTLKELKKLNIKDSQKIPQLEEVLNLIKQKVKINIELKGANTAKPVLKIIEKYVKNKKWKYDDFLISSFDFDELEKFYKLNNKIKLGILIDKVPKNLEEFAKSINAYSLNIDLRITNLKIVEYAHNIKLKVFVWTVNKEKDIEKMKKINVDGIFSNYPDRI